MEVLQRIFKGNDMSLSGRIDVIHHTGQGSGLAASGRTGHQNKPLFAVGQVYYAFRYSQIVGIRDVEINDPDDSGKGTPLFKGGHPEPGNAP